LRKWRTASGKPSRLRARRRRAHLRFAPGVRASRPRARRRREIAQGARSWARRPVCGVPVRVCPLIPPAPCSHTVNAPRGEGAVRRRRKTHTPRRVPAQAALLAVLTPGASSAGNAAVGAPPDGNDTGAAIPAHRGAASPNGARMGTLALDTSRAGMTGGAAHRSPRGFAQERTECAYAPRQESPADDSDAPAHGGAPLSESSADHGHRVCEKLPGACANQGARSPSMSRC